MMRWLPLLALLVALPASAASHISRDPDMRTPRQAKMRPLRWASPVAARYRFESTGSAWEIPSDAPAPVVDCSGDFRSGNCGATTFTPSGSPGFASTYWRPGGGSAPGAGVAFDGLDDGMTGGTAGHCDGDQFVCVRLTTSTTEGARFAFAKWAGGNNEFALYRSGAALVFSIGKSGGAKTDLTLTGSMAVGVEYVACAAYDYVADGTSVLRGNISGSVPAEITTAVGPPAVGGVISIGSADGSSYRWAGTISSVLRGCYAPSAADLSRMTRAQHGALGALGEPITVGRASVKSCGIGGSWFTAPAGQPCLGSAGISAEGARTQYALANCGAPADQTVTLAAGTYALWMEGSGTVAAAVGTATAPGLPCTASAASACTFTVATGGTVTLDVTGTVSRMQLESGALRSSAICSTTTPSTRAADAVSVESNLNNAEGCIGLELVPPSIAHVNTPRVVSADGAGPAAPLLLPFSQGESVTTIGFFDGTNTISLSPGFSAGSRVRVSAWWKGSAAGVKNLMTGAETVGAYDGSLFGATTKIGLGSAIGGGSELYGSIRSVTTGRTRDACDAAGPAERVVCLGDSITAGNYPAMLGTGLGSTYSVTNSGVSGNTTAQMETRWNASLSGAGYEWIVVLGGINDVAKGATAADSYEHLLAVAESAKSQGVRVVILTVLPWKNHVYWTEGRQAETDALNGMIRATSGVTVIDAYALFGDADPRALLAAYDSGDGLHPNDTGKAAIAALVKAVITR